MWGSGGHQLNPSEYNLWFLGFTIFVLGTLAQALGANIQRFAARSRQIRHDGTPEPPDSPEPAAGAKKKKSKVGDNNKPLQIAGLVLFAFGGIFCSLSLIFSSESLVAPLILLLFIFNPIFAWLLNGETFTYRTDGVCTVFAIVGVGCVVGFAPKDSASYTAAHIEYLCGQSTAVSFFFVVLGCVILAYWYQQKLLPRVRIEKAGYDIATSSRSEGAETGSTTSSKPTSDIEPATHFESNFVHLSYGGLAGAMGGINVTLTKAIFSVIIAKSRVAHDVGDGMRMVFGYWLFWVFSVAIVISYYFEMYFTAKGLSLVGSMIYVPTFVVVEQCTIAMGAMLFFQDFHYFDTAQATAFALGNLTALIAVITMAWLRLQADHEKAAAARPTEASALLSAKSPSDYSKA